MIMMVVIPLIVKITKLTYVIYSTSGSGRADAECWVVPA